MSIETGDNLELILESIPPKVGDYGRIKTKDGKLHFIEIVNVNSESGQIEIKMKHEH